MLTAIAVLILSSGIVASNAYSSSGYQGRVIDAETGAPLEGVVVLGVWYTKLLDASHYLDSKETVTDSNGDFSIPPLGMKTLSAATKLEVPQDMDIVIYKAGYEDIDGPWKSLKEARFFRDRIKWEGDKAIIPLKKLTAGERRKRSRPFLPLVPGEKQKLLQEEMRKGTKEPGHP
jgi:hypothetical protein